MPCYISKILRLAAYYFLAALVSGKTHALVILQYQDIGVANSANSISTETFENHLSFIEDANLKVITLVDLAKLLAENKPLPDKTVIISFDYGTVSLYENAWPLLKKHNFPFSIMISPSLQDNGAANLMTWEQLKILSQAGVIVGNRSYKGEHLLRKLNNENTARWQARVLADIDKAERLISEKLNQNHKFLAYPYGEYSRELDTLITHEGYLTFGTQPGPVPTYPSGSVIPRFSFTAGTGNEQDFQLKAMSLPMPIAQITVLSEGGSPLTDPELPLEVSRPVLKLYMESPVARSTVCFISGQGAGESKMSQFGVQFQAKKSLTAGGRSYYNCSAPTEDATRHYWYSQFFITRKKDGSWYQEQNP